MLDLFYLPCSSKVNFFLQYSLNQMVNHLLLPGFHVFPPNFFQAHSQPTFIVAFKSNEACFQVRYMTTKAKSLWLSKNSKATISEKVCNGMHSLYWWERPWDLSLAEKGKKLTQKKLKRNLSILRIRKSINQEDPQFQKMQPLFLNSTVLSYVLKLV